MSGASGGIWAVVPVKPFALAKQRLAGAFTPDFRRLLARAMLCDVLSALREARGLAGFAVISPEPEAGRLVQACGGRWLMESEVRGLNAAVSQAAALLAADGAFGMLVLPGDLPTVQPNEIARLVDGHTPGRGVSLVPAQDGEGTCGLLVTPPELIAFAYGPSSLMRHAAAAQAIGGEPRLYAADELPGIAFDVDRPEDVARLAGMAAGGHTRTLLTATCLYSRHCAEAR